MVEFLNTPDTYRVNHTVHTVLGYCICRHIDISLHAAVIYVADIQRQTVLSLGCLTVSERTERFCVH